MRKNLLSLSSIVLSMLLFSFSAFAQSQFGEISGTVTDPNGAVVPNATVTVTGLSIGLTRTAVTNASGFYAFRQLPPGNYNVSVAATAGFAAKEVQNQNVALETTTTVNVALSVTGGTTTVEVTSDELVAPVDVGSTKVQTNISAAKIELLPKGVDFTSVLKTAPGTRGEGLAGGISVDGASGSENVFIIDGQEVTNFRTGTLNPNNAIPNQLIQEVQVKSSGFEAEFGGATGGVVNVVTKGGSNEWRGEFGAQWQSPKLNGGNRPSLLRFGAGDGPTEYLTSPKAGGYNFFPTATLSGPVIKDRLWFLGSYTPQIYTSNTTTKFYTSAPAATRTYRFEENYRATTRYEYAFGRIDAQPINSVRMNASFLWNPQINDGLIPFGTISLGGNPASLTLNGTTYAGADLYKRQGGRQTSNNFASQVTWTPTSNFYASGRFSRGFLNQKGTNYFVFSNTSYRCIVDVGGYCPQGQSDPSPSLTSYDVSVRTNIEADATFFSNVGGVRNEIKGGYQWFRIKNDVDAGYKNKGIIRIWMGYTIQDIGALSTPDPNAIGAGELIRFGTAGSGQNTNQSIYIQDKIQFGGRVTVNAGVRFESEDLPSFNGLAPPIKFGWGDKIAPRLGVSIGLNKSGTSKIWASYGQFYDRLKFELPRGSFGGDFYRWDYFEIFANSPNWRSFTIPQIIGSWPDTIGGSCPQTGFIAAGALSRCQYDYRIASNAPGADIYTGKVDPNLKPFQQVEFTAGFQHQFAKNYVFGSRFTWKNVESAIEDAGILTPDGSEAYIIGNPGSGLHAEVLSQLGYARTVEPKRNYRGLEFSLDRRLANNFYFNVNYTYSRLYGNYSGLASSDENGRTSPGVNRFFDLPYIGFTYQGNTDDGLLATDRTHVVNSYGAYIFDWMDSKTHSTELSYFQTFQSGTPQTTLVAFHSTGTPIPFYGRGDLGRTPMFSQTDFAVTHKYKFGRDNRFTLAFDVNVLNLLDQKTVTSVFNTLSAVNVSEGTLCPGETIVQCINRLTSGQLASGAMTYLNGAASRRDSRYGLDNGFQGPRSVRFGLRLSF